MKATFPGQTVVVGSAPDGLKMSEVLEAFVAPYRESIDTTRESFTKLLSLAIGAWNVTLLPEKERESEFHQLLGALPEEVREDGREIIEQMMERKRRLFSGYRRSILDFEVADTGTGWHLSVISTATPM